MIDAEERASMEETVRGALADAVANGGETADVDGVLAKLDWLEMLREHPDDAIGIVFGALGATNATATALDDVMATALGWEPRADLAVLLPPFGGWDPPGRVGGRGLHGRGLATARVAEARDLLIVCTTASGTRAAVVPAAPAGVRPVHGVDPGAGLHAVEVQGSAEAVRHGDPDAWPKALALGRRALAHQMEGACRTMLELARTHALERVQFGRPIARFQAVRHRLAEALVAVEALEASLTAARRDPGPETAALAKAVAGRASHTVARHAQQVLAGIGFTAEHPFHRFLKRAMVLEGLFGSADAIVVEVGRRLVSERRVPTLIEL
jgi:Acyl-CoA dehydrogenase, C-terminal domain